MTKELVKTSEEEVKRILDELKKTSPTDDKYPKLIDEYNKLIDVNSKIQKNYKDGRVDIHKAIDSATKVGTMCLFTAGLVFEFTGGYFKSDLLKAGIRGLKLFK